MLWTAKDIALEAADRVRKVCLLHIWRGSKHINSRKLKSNKNKPIKEWHGIYIKHLAFLATREGKVSPLNLQKPSRVPQVFRLTLAVNLITCAEETSAKGLLPTDLPTDMSMGHFLGQ